MCLSRTGAVKAAQDSNEGELGHLRAELRALEDGISSTEQSLKQLDADNAFLASVKFDWLLHISRLKFSD
jgi:hypothetical protein